MADLETYRRKRDFARTPEPAGDRRRAPGKRGLGFVVQRHAARRLHYDFRLELDGVLKSWAVPNGPSLDPQDRRLAVHVEDHPLEYGDFEGVIPAGQYGGGTVQLWDRGRWLPLDEDPAAALAEGRLHFVLEGERLKGRWTLVRRQGRRGEPREAQEAWFLIKGRDEHARPGEGTAAVDRHRTSIVSGRTLDRIATAADRVWDSRTGEAEPAPAPRRRKPTPPRLDPPPRGARKAPLPDRLAPQLASPAATAPEGEDWLHELKHDGYRILARREGERVLLLTRNRLDWTGRFPQIAEAVRALPVAAAFLDGEVVRLDSTGRSDFGLLQQALAEDRTDDLVYQAFDLPYLEGYDLRAVRLEDRKALLQALLAGWPDPRLRYSDHVAGEGPAFHARACELGVEGMIAKRRDAPYRSGRSRDWLKVKCDSRGEFVILGFTPPGTATRQGFGALLLGRYDPEGRLHYAGRCGTGFTGPVLQTLRSRLEALLRSSPPLPKRPAGLPRGVRWVEPRLVAEVRHGGWTREGLLRHAAFLGLREDKAPAEAQGNGTHEPGAPAASSPRRARPAAVEAPAITNPDKPLYPDDGIAKRDLAEYWRAVAPQALPHIAGRVLSLVRCPDGIGRPCFFQKHAMPGLPAAIRRIEVPEEGGRATGLHVADAAGLIALVQMGVIEVHCWGSRIERLEKPDRLVFDLDPDESLPWERVVDAALELRRLLERLGLASFVRTTGGKGLHLVLPVRPELEWDRAKALTKAIAETLRETAPERYTTTMAKRARRGRIFIDYLRNGRGATAIGNYSPRARPGAPVAMPIAWSELERGVDPRRFTLSTVPAGLARRRRDPWPGFEDGQRLAPLYRRLVG